MLLEALQVTSVETGNLWKLFGTFLNRGITLKHLGQLKIYFKSVGGI